MDKIPFSSLTYIHKECETELKSAFERVLTSNWFIQGQECKKFEKQASGRRGRLPAQRQWSG